jgi:hypothetical protein
MLPRVASASITPVMDTPVAVVEVTFMARGSMVAGMLVRRFKTSEETRAKSGQLLQSPADRKAG